MKIYESMLKGASSDLEDACALGRDAVLSPPTMSEHDMRQLRLFFAVDLHNNQATMGTFTKELIKVHGQGQINYGCCSKFIQLYSATL